MRQVAKKLSVLALGLVLSTSALAANLKIGVVDIRELASKSKEIAKAKTELGGQFKSRQQEIVALQEKLKKDIEEFKRNASVMTQKDKNSAQEKIIKTRQEYAVKGQTYEQDVAKAQQQLTNNFLKKVKSAVDDIAKTDKYDLILQKDNVPYSATALDITSQVMKKL